jgi:hypothetical protein
MMTFDGIYRDDGLVVMKGNWSKQDVANWLRDFQNEINRVTKYEGLQFTVSIWGPEKKDNTPHPKVTVEKTDYLPFLDMKLYWDEWGDLAFTVYRKDGQLPKYLNADSTHPPHVFGAVPHSVLARLANLTTLTEENGNKTMKEIHPDHISTLSRLPTSTSMLYKNETNPTKPLHYWR